MASSLLKIYLATLLLCELSASYAPPSSCIHPQTKLFPFCNNSLPISSRVSDLVSRLTLNEKISQLTVSASPIPRLGIPAFQWWSEALHGLSDFGPGLRFNGSTIKAATSFPQVILTAASFDTRIWHRIGRAIGREARAMYNQGQADGLTLWAPNINIYRDPRWGRGQETPGEDPYVNAQYALAYVRGVQGEPFEGPALKSRTLLASACCKHFTAYDLEKWNGTDRFTFNARVTPQDLADTFQPPFQSCVQQGKASGIMCAYNLVNGVPNCANYNLLTNVARRKWGFRGYIASDCLAVQFIHERQGYAKTPEDAVADVLKAGMDVECGLYLRNHTLPALQQKKIDTMDIDRAVRNLFAVRMRLGLFSGDPRSHPFGRIGAKHVCSRKHQKLALEAARRSIVLLKNVNNILPVPQKTVSLAVLGPSANSSVVLQGNYFGPPCQSVTPLKALEAYAEYLKYQSGCNDTWCVSLDGSSALETAREADYVVMIMGLSQKQEGEGIDRNDLLLPGKQQEFVTRVASVSKKPVILVLLCGGPVDISFAKNDPKIGGILWAGYPGEAGGVALAEIIFGEHNPGGRLPVTWYPQEFTSVAMTDMRMRPDSSQGYPGRTYRFYQGTKVYEFGFGLSYGRHVYKFNYVSHDSVKVSETCENIRVSVGVQNLGSMSSSHSILLFVRRGVELPTKQLIGFRSVKLEAGESRDVLFEVNPCKDLRMANTNGFLIVNEGWHFFMVEDEEFPFNIVF